MTNSANSGCLVGVTRSIRNYNGPLTVADTAYLLVSATTTLLRCTVETSNVTEKRQSALALLGLLDTLRTAHLEYDWDLAVLCIDTCGQSIEKVAAANHIATETAASAPAASPMSTTVLVTQGLGPVTTLQYASTNTQPTTESNDLHFSLDIPWDHLWDDTAEPWGLLSHY